MTKAGLLYSLSLFLIQDKEAANCPAESEIRLNNKQTPPVTQLF